MSSTVDQIKERLSVVDVVSSYLKLEKAGRNLKARCPFHNEKTPSFFVSPERNSFHCFGCNRGGDVFTFVEEIEGVDFRDALVLLAERAGIRIEREDPRAESEKQMLFRAMEEAALYFERILTGRSDVLGYLKGRGLSERTVRDFRVGFALNGWRALLSYLGERGFPEEVLERAGLVVGRGGRHYDRFRGRIMFPITNGSGRVVAFSGRIFGEHDESAWKYINSPETPLYNKSRILYGYDKAKRAMREQDACVLVEGQMDVIMSHQCGASNTVAVSGTALTESHLSLVSRMTPNIILAFDPDAAGLAASGRSIDLALSLGFDVRAAALPKGVDPADLARTDCEELKRRLLEAEHVVMFYLHALRKEAADERSYRRKVSDVVLHYIARIRNKIDQAHFVGEVASALRLPEEPIWEEVKRIFERAGGIPLRREEGGGERGAAAENGLSPHAARQKRIEEQIAGLVAWVEGGVGASLNTGRLKEEYHRVTGRSVEEMVRELPARAVEKSVFERESAFQKEEKGVPDGAALESEALELILNLEEHIVRGKLKKAANDLKYAEGMGDEALVSEKLEEFKELSRALRMLSENKQ